MFSIFVFLHTKLKHFVVILFDIHLFVGKLDSLGDLRLEVWHHLVEPSLFVIRDFSESHDLRDTVGSKLAGGREEFGIRNVGFDKGALHNIIGTVHGLEDLVGEEVSGVGHGKGCRSGSGLGLNDLVSTELGSFRDCLEFFAVGVVSGNLREEGKNGNSGVSANHWNVDFTGITSGRGADKSVGSNDVKGSHTTKLFGIKDALLLEDLGGNWDGRVDWVGNNGQDGIGAKFGTSLDKSLDNTGVCAEKIVTGHTRLARNSGRNDNHIGSGQAGLKTGIVGWRPSSGRWKASRDGGVARNVRQIGGDTRGSDNIIQRKLGNLRRELEKQTQRLTDASVGTQNGNFLSHGGCGRVEAIVVLFGSDAQDAAGSVGKHDGKKSGMDRVAMLFVCQKW